MDLTPDRTRSDIPLNLNQNSSLELYMKMRHRTSVQCLKWCLVYFTGGGSANCTYSDPHSEETKQLCCPLCLHTSLLLLAVWYRGPHICHAGSYIYTLLAWQDILTVFCVMYSVCITQHEHLNIPHSFQLW